jgi:TPR repeat protein
MSDNIKLQDTKNKNESIKKEHSKFYNYEEFNNFQEIGAAGGIGKVYRTDLKNFCPQFSNNQIFNEDSLLNNLESQEELFQLIQNFEKINIKEIDPIIMSNEREKNLFEKGFDIITDEINDHLIKLANKRIDWQLLKKEVKDFFNNHNINLKEIYNWLLNNQNYNSNSIFLLGYFIFYGIETNIDYKKAFNLFINASEKNHIFAQFFVGSCYKYGNGTMKNDKLAFEYYEKSANNNFTHGQLEVGYFCKNGMVVKKDLKKAFYWFEKATNNGNIIAMHVLGNCYKQGEGVEKNKNKSFELFKQSSEGGYSSGMTSLGYCYDNGIGTEIDMQKAFELYQESAKLGSITGQFNLGNMYEHGDVVTQDIDKAIYWYKKSAKQGDQEAKKKLEKLKNQ